METLTKNLTRHENLTNEIEKVINEFENLKGKWHRYNSDELIYDMLVRQSDDYNTSAYNLKSGIELLIKLFLDPEKSASIPTETKKYAGVMLPNLLDFFSSLTQEENMDSIDIFNFRGYGHSMTDYELELMLHDFSGKIEDLKAKERLFNGRSKINKIHERVRVS